MEEDWKKKTIQARNKVRDRLFSMTENEARSQSNEMWYARMRYIREIEAHEFSRALNRMGMTREKAIKYAKEKSDWVVLNWKIEQRNYV